MRKRKSRKGKNPRRQQEGKPDLRRQRPEAKMCSEGYDQNKKNFVNKVRMAFAALFLTVLVSDDVNLENKAAAQEDVVIAAKSAQTEASSDAADYLKGYLVPMENLISMSELKMEELEAELLPKIKDLEKDDFDLAQDLLVPFKAIRANRANQVKSYADMLKKYAGSTVNIEPGHFYYSYIPEKNNDPNISAAFVPLKRLLYLGRSFDPNNFIDLLVLYHELFHVAQDDQLRHKINLAADDSVAIEMLKAYQKFYGVDRRIFFKNELHAYAYEIELLNLKLDNALREGNVTVEDLMSRFELRPEQKHIVNFLIEISKLYYSNYGREKISPEFCKQLYSEYLTNGFSMYEAVPGENRLKRFTASSCE